MIEHRTSVFINSGLRTSIIGILASGQDELNSKEAKIFRLLFQKEIHTHIQMELVAFIDLLTYYIYSSLFHNILKVTYHKD